MITRLWQQWTGRHDERPILWSERLAEARTLRRSGYYEAAAIVARIALELRTRELAQELENGRAGRPRELPRRFGGVVQRLTAHMVVDAALAAEMRRLYAMTSGFAHGRHTGRTDAYDAIGQIEAVLGQLWKAGAK